MVRCVGDLLNTSTYQTFASYAMLLVIWIENARKSWEEERMLNLVDG
jgi:hypothetical protein